MAGPELEESAEDLYENAPCGYVSAMPDGTIVRINQTFLAWTGHRREDLVGRRRFQELLTPGGRIFHETHYAPLLRLQGTVREIAVEIVCADGRRLPALINTVLLRDEDGMPRLTRTTVFNATDRKAYERELLRERRKAEEATKAKADFLAMVNHEIRNPLTAIHGAVILLETTELAPQQQKLVQILRSSSKRLLDLVTDVLDLSKADSGTSSLEERSLDLRELVLSIADGLRGEAEGKGLALDVRVDEGVPAAVLGDPVKIGQIVANLLGNAVKFTPSGSVTLALEVRERHADAVTVGFRIADTGIGVEAERLPYIFDEFTQASYDIGLKYGGSGLGLTITRKLVELYGSAIEVESEPGKGTAFSFALRLRLPGG